MADKPKDRAEPTQPTQPDQQPIQPAQLAQPIPPQLLQMLRAQAQPQQHKDIIYINYFDMIDMARVKAIMIVCSSLMKQFTPKELYFLFASPGGQIGAGIVLYHFLKAIPVQITMHNMGQVDSIANVIFMAGDKRLAAPHSSFHFHGAGMDTRPGQRFVLSNLKEIASQLEEDHNKIAGILQGNTKLSREEILDFFNEGAAKNAQFALDKGIISEIIVPQIPEGAELININVNIQPANIQ
jgi:ATP-dependent Clp protease protease subunit